MDFKKIIDNEFNKEFESAPEAAAFLQTKTNAEHWGKTPDKYNRRNFEVYSYEGREYHAMFHVTENGNIRVSVRDVTDKI